MTESEFVNELEQELKASELTELVHSDGWTVEVRKNDLTTATINGYYATLTRLQIVNLRRAWMLATYSTPEGIEATVPLNDLLN